MCAKRREATRYDVVGRVECEELAAFPGSIVDLSSVGCKIHYSTPVTVSKEAEYKVLIKLSGQDMADSLELICQPVWVSENKESTDMGMKFLHSPDTDLLNQYIKILHLDTQISDAIKNQIVETECQFI